MLFLLDDVDSYSFGFFIRSSHFRFCIPSTAPRPPLTSNYMEYSSLTLLFLSRWFRFKSFSIRAQLMCPVLSIVIARQGIIQ